MLNLLPHIDIEIYAAIALLVVLAISVGIAYLTNDVARRARRF